MSVLPAADLLRHLREATQQTLNYVEGREREDFLADKRTQQAVILNLIILGEAATKLMDRYPETVTAMPEIEW